eukprot:scaffold267474_cov23-Tisochrysis_lutea.AAC.1
MRDGAAAQTCAWHTKHYRASQAELRTGQSYRGAAQICVRSAFQGPPGLVEQHLCGSAVRGLH